MLDYLVTSRTRLKLLQLLWVEGVVASVSELARRGDLAYAGAYRELRAMASAKVASVTFSQREAVFRANRNHPQAAALATLLEAPTPVENDDEALLSLLSEQGLPVFSSAEANANGFQSSEEMILSAVAMARRDATVARALPVLIARHRERLDLQRLRELATDSETKHAVGFFLDLTGKLINESRLRHGAKSFVDRRRRVPRAFFHRDNDSPFSTKLAERRTPELARRWGWLMNLGEDSFREMVERFGDDAAL